MLAKVSHIPHSKLDICFQNTQSDDLTFCVSPVFCLTLFTVSFCLWMPSVLRAKREQYSTEDGPCPCQSVIHPWWGQLCCACASKTQIQALADPNPSNETGCFRVYAVGSGLKYIFIARCCRLWCALIPTTVLKRLSLDSTLCSTEMHAAPKVLQPTISVYPLQILNAYFNTGI